MSIINSFSKIYLVIIGEHTGRTCVIHEFKENLDGFSQIIFADNDKDEFMFIETGSLAQLKTPGWPAKIYHPPYGIKEHFEKHSGAGTNMLRTESIAQPRALKKNDTLATREIVIETPRRGFNSSCLIHLSRVGWVELPPRLPIALLGNKNYRFPIELRKNEKLVTGCSIVKTPNASRLNWVNISLDRENCCIEVPSCIPLVLM